MENAIEILQQNYKSLPQRDHEFAESLLSQYDRRGSLSVKQSEWVEELAKRATTPQAEQQKTELGSFAGVIEFFKNAGEHLKYPKIRLQLADGSPIVLSVAGSGSKAPGTVNVTDGKPFHQNKWYGRVTPSGEWQKSHKADDVVEELEALLKKLGANPARVAADYGKLTGNCAFCKSTLSYEKSTDVGYGPVCAKKWSLPWGSKPAF